jgi:hypothetical protein
MEIRDKLKKKDGAQFKCIARRPGTDGIGHIYTFSCSRRQFASDCNFPAVERHEPLDDLQDQAGFRFWNDELMFYTDIPCPTTIQHRLGRTFKFHRCSGLLSDTEYAELVVNNDFVVDKGTEFYHDMVQHVRKRLPLTTIDETYKLKPEYLAEGLVFYKTLYKHDPVVELCFGIAADHGMRSITPEDFIMSVSKNWGWQLLLQRRFGLGICHPDPVLARALQLADPVMHLVEFWERFHSWFVKTYSKPCPVEIPTIARVMEQIFYYSAHPVWGY